MRRAVLGVLLVWFSAAAAEPVGTTDGGTREPVPASAPDSGSDDVESRPVGAHDVISSAEIARRPAGTTAQLLDEKPGVFLQRPHAAGAAVNLRGFSGVDVALRLNGARLNTATSTPWTALTALDPFWVERIEITRGLSPVLYGSDALGGVIELETVSPQYSPDGSLIRTARAALTAGTAALGARGHLRAGVSLANTAATVGVTGFSVSDLSGGARVGAQPYSANEGWSIGAALRQRLTPRLELELRYHGSREDVLLPTYSSPGDVRHLGGQERHFVHARGRFAEVGPFVGHLDLTAQRQRSDTNRIDLSQDLRSLDAAAEWSFGSRLELRTRRLLDLFTLRVGAEASYDLVSARFMQGSLSTGAPTERMPLLSRYAEPSSELDSAIFLYAETAAAGPWHASGGVRASFSHLQLGADPRGLVPGPAVGRSAFGFSGEAGVERELLSWLSLLVRGAAAHRAPNLDELSRLGSLGWGFLLPTRGLEDAMFLSAEGGLRAKGGPLSLDAFYGFTHASRPITLARTTFAGVPSVAGEPYLERINAREARVHSLDATLMLRLPAELQLSANVSAVIADEQRTSSSELTPLSRTPPANGTWKLAYVPEAPWFAELGLRWGMAQRRLSELDRLDPAICGPTLQCSPTDSFTALHLRGGWRPTRHLGLTAEVANLANATYRYHGSALDEPGLSLRLGVEGSL